LASSRYLSSLFKYLTDVFDCFLSRLDRLFRRLSKDSLAHIYAARSCARYRCRLSSNQPIYFPFTRGILSRNLL
jgi:hypothetical protein